MDEEQTCDDLTPEETEQAAEVGATPEQEHRLAEFDALNTKLDALNTKLDYVLTAIGDVTSVANAVSVDNGAAFTDSEAEIVEGAEVEIADTVEDPRERDYTIER